MSPSSPGLSSPVLDGAHTDRERRTCFWSTSARAILPGSRTALLDKQGRGSETLVRMYGLKPPAQVLLPGMTVPRDQAPC